MRLVAANALLLVLAACANGADEAGAATTSTNVATSTSMPAPAAVPSFADPVPVSIVGYDDHAMEPFLSRDGRLLFFNSRNDGVTTSLHVARRHAPTRFTYIGEVSGANGEPPHLDAVASMDVAGRFYWVSTRDYPEVFENLHTAKFADGDVSDAARVQGDFYIRRPGWIVMDAEISADGGTLVYANARFEDRPVPVESQLAVAQRRSEEFTVVPEGKVALAAVNALGLVYAPSLSPDGTELYVTALADGDTAVYVATRPRADVPFGEPIELVAGGLVEAATVAPEGIYVHRRVDGRFTIHFMERLSS